MRRAQDRSRREVLRAEGLGLFGLGLPALLKAHGLAPRPSSATFGRAKACIVLLMGVGSARRETWDLKPDAPEQVRGEFRPIVMNVPGVAISEHFPLLARQTNRLALILSVLHADVNHTPPPMNC